MYHVPPSMDTLLLCLCEPDCHELLRRHGNGRTVGVPVLVAILELHLPPLFREKKSAMFLQPSFPDLHFSSHQSIFQLLLPGIVCYFLFDSTSATQTGTRFPTWLASTAENLACLYADKVLDL